MAGKCELCDRAVDELNAVLWTPEDWGEQDITPELLELCDECTEKEEEKKKNPLPLGADGVVGRLRDLIESEALDDYFGNPGTIVRTETFKEAMLLTNDSGFVLRIGREEYQITVVRSR